MGRGRGRDSALQGLRHLTSSPHLPHPLRTVHIMDPGCLYYGIQPVGAVGASNRRDGRGVCQDRAEHR